MTRKWMNTGFGVLAIIGLFLPLASAGGLFITLDKLGGISLLLYLLPFTLLALAITDIYKPNIQYMKAWLAIVGLAGIILSMVSTYTGIGQVNAFVATMAALDDRQQQFEETFRRTEDIILNSRATQSPTGSREDNPGETTTPRSSAWPASGAFLLLLGFSGATVSTLARRNTLTAAKATILSGEGDLSDLIDREG